MYEYLTAQAGWYHGANVAHTNAYNTAPNAQAESSYTETADTFANLAMAATADKDLLTTSTSTNAALTEQLAAKYRMISSLQAQLH
jgi:hypothetical protein